MKDALILLVLGMGTVFCLLYIINLMIVVLGKLVGPKKKEADPTREPAEIKATVSPAVAAAPADPMQEELILLLGAAVAAYLGTTPDKIRLVVRPVENSSAWSQAGRLEGMF